MHNNTKVYFIFALPRSGSTYVQSLIANSSREIETGPEPWFFPLVSQLHADLTFSVSGVESSTSAASHYFKDLEGFLLETVVSMYNHVTPKGKSFLDKTPRNLFYIDAIKSCYGLNSSVVLLRHPVDIVLSSFQVFGKGRPSFTSMLADFNLGAQNLQSCIAQNIPVVKYEELLLDPTKILPVVKGLGIAVDHILQAEQLIKENSSITAGDFGDTKFRKKIPKDNSTSCILLLTAVLVVRFTNLRKLKESYYSEVSLIGELSSRRNRIKRIGVFDGLWIITTIFVGIFNLKVVYKKFKLGSTLYWVR